MNIENPVFVPRKLKNEKPSRSAKIYFYIAGTHAGVGRRFRAPGSGHRIAVRVELRLNVGKIFEGLAFRWFHLKLKQRGWPVQIQNVRLSCVPDPQPRCANGKHRHTNGH